MAEHNTSLKRGSIGILHIVFFVVATAGPLVSLVGAAPAAVAFGNAAGLPGTYVLVAILYLLFSVGFTAMGSHVTNAGAFFAYIAQGLGPRIGVGGAFIAVLAYMALQVGTYALFGIFCAQGLTQIGGPTMSWWVFALGACAAVHMIGRRTVAFSGQLLGVLLVCEIALVLLLDGAIVAAPTPLRLEHFSPARVFGEGFGASLAFVVPCFLGFEATAIFGEEAKDPTRTIPRATYAAVAMIGAIYTFSSWAIMSSYPLDGVRAIATEHGATFVFDIAQRLLGRRMVILATCLMISSMFAALLSLHNVVARYFYSLARAGLLPKVLAQTHRQHHSPHRAGQVQTIIAVLIIALFAVSGLDAYNLMFAWSTALGALCILVVQTIASFAVFAYFRRADHGMSRWTAAIAPLLAAIGLGGCLVALVINLPLIAATRAIAIWALPIVPVVIGGGGMIAARLRRTSMAQIDVIAA